MSKPVADLDGKTFGSWTVVGYSHVDGGNHYWTCRCRCGVVKPVFAGSLLARRSRSCSRWCVAGVRAATKS